MTHTHQPDDLLRRTESYLSALHGSVARHDNLAANYGCAGCELRDQTRAALRAAASVPAQAPTTQAAALSDAEQTMLAYALDQAQERIWVEGGFTEEDQAAVDSLRRRAVLPANQTTDRAAILRAEAEHLLRDLYPAVYEDAGQKTAQGVNRAVRELLDRATAAELQAEVYAASGPHDTDDTTGQAEPQADFQDRGEAARRAAGIDGTAGDAQDVTHTFVLDEATGGCLVCGLSPTYRKHAPAVVSQPDGEA
ncbi:hypothetical protein [Streptomyces sp. NPDC060027]|uniref:hypothetical protein n=1 Tax=Streptomyces sp. NPDC060027 TaxID=3347040 RepID=UPI00368447A8